METHMTNNTINHCGIEITVDYPATLADNGISYVASGRDNQGNRYDIIWDCTDAWLAAQEAYKTALDANVDLDIATERFLDNESNACDWDVYTVSLS